MFADLHPSDQLAHPAMRVGGVAGLDGEQCLPQLRGDRPGVPSPTVQSPWALLTNPTGRDDGGGAAREDLGEHARLVAGLPLVGGDLALLGAVAEIAGDASAASRG